VSNRGGDSKGPLQLPQQSCTFSPLGIDPLYTIPAPPLPMMLSSFKQSKTSSAVKSNRWNAASFQARASLAFTGKGGAGMVEVVCKSAGLGDDAIELGVFRALLSAVRSPGVLIRRGIL
jgi:hypothetical protein